jgi:hypothetical protein
MYIYTGNQGGILIPLVGIQLMTVPKNNFKENSVDLNSIDIRGGGVGTCGKISCETVPLMHHIVSGPVPPYQMVRTPLCFSTPGR